MSLLAHALALSSSKQRDLLMENVVIVKIEVVPFYNAMRPTGLSREPRNRNGHDHVVFKLE